MLDSFRRNIEYLRISVTDRCNLRCRYCMPEGGVCKKRHSDIVSYELIRRVVETAVPMGLIKVRLTGGEPLVRKGIVSLVQSLAQVPGIGEITMTSNGLLMPQFAWALKEAGLCRVNVSLDTLDEERYRWLTRGGRLSEVMKGLDSLDRAGFERTKINMVLIPEFNDVEVADMQIFCQERGYRLQRIHRYHLSDYHSIDFSSEAERPTACHFCNRIRMTADGKLKPCLFSDREIPIDPDRIADSLRQAIEGKPAAGTANQSRGNWEIGG